ncbi:MAG: magnesium/cobalt transporter CorA [Methanotrichaceae archaeon]|nr:magnesium/cobalt transporter CorA [Methanotrichaceae archaeon]
MSDASTVEQINSEASKFLLQSSKHNGLKISVIDYDESHYHEAIVNNIEDCFAFKAQPTITWIHIIGLRQVDILEKLGTCYGFHPLVLEDILSDQRPKVEDYDDYIFVVLKTLYYQESESELEADQISIILGPNYVVSFKEKEGDILRLLRYRLRTGKGRIRKMGADYLAYSMIDAIVDHYFVIAEKLGEMFEDVEDAVVTKPDPETLPTIYNLKRDMLFLRKSVWPLREAISHLQRTESPLVSETTKIYLRDVYDHTIQIIENIETLRDMSSSLLDTYISSLSNRLNEVIKLLTIISTIFIPLTFISGVYGMNFKYMPILESRWGYTAVITFMILLVVIMLSYFRRKKWL